MKKIIKIFEVQYEINNPDWYQSRMIVVEDWNVYVNNVLNYKMQNGYFPTIPRTTKPENVIEGKEWLEFDYKVPDTGNLRKHRSWVIQFG